MELLKGFLYLHLDLGNGPTKIRASNKLLNDGAWHHVIVVRTLRSGNVKVDGDNIDFETPGREEKLEVDGKLYIGGVDNLISSASNRAHGVPANDVYDQRTSTNAKSRWIPPVLWTASLRKGFVGCFRDFSINGRTVDLADYAKRQDTGNWSKKNYFYFPEKYN